MSLQEEVDLLRTIPLFSRIEPSRLKLLAFTAQRLTFAPGDLLCRQGDEGDAAYIIITGDADVLVESESGPVKVATLGPNDLLGENAILCDVPRTATVKATTKVETLMISKELFFQLINQFPSISIEIMRELARRVEKTTTMLRDAMATRTGT
ncbi:MAG: cyclic nucleotide-binding domain-containing protein [bacterium]|nr:cyclic nucleotide-binding domain-containing protein [bacterium]MDE0243037.1 cyclic nucleotide-binding domain-containing protein [bacterium]MDE0416072.1 cyclic nucleotide-binding domain-containing protein [bacterium]